MAQEWGFYEVVVGVVALLFTLIGAAWALYWRYKNRKNIRYSVIESVSLIVRQPGAERLRILFDDLLMQNPYITIIEIKNDGRVPVIPDDFVGRVSIYGDTKMILSAVVSDKDPDNLNPSITFDKSIITVEPLLLNGGDSFKINLLTEEPFRSPKVVGRIAGVKRIEEISKELVEKRRKWAEAIFVVILAILMNILIEWLRKGV